MLGNVVEVAAPAALRVPTNVAWHPGRRADVDALAGRIERDTAAQRMWVERSLNRVDYHPAPAETPDHCAQICSQIVHIVVFWVENKITRSLFSQYRWPCSTLANADRHLLSPQIRIS